MNACIVPGCENNGVHQIKLTVRRPGSNTGAVVAPTLPARVCLAHLAAGLEIDITVRAPKRRTGRLEITTVGERAGVTTPPARKVVQIPTE
jgi:hypothetical protein